MILFEKCDSEKYQGPGECKSDQEIKEWLARKFIIVLQNTSRFSTREYNEKKVAKESRIVWIPINSQVREEIVFKV